jgi:hypothetical protein|tara:strand:+ start:4291 stop:4467 length:177 start_codon:yes stop_codon:yes gene_type:complete
MKIGDLVTLKEAWVREGVSSFGIIIDIGEHRRVETLVRWSNGMETYEPSFGLKVLSEF